MQELIRSELAEHGAAVRPEDMLAGTITMVYRGDMGRVRHQLSQTQAEYLKVISSQHVFLEDDQSLEVLLVQGSATRLRNLCDSLPKVRGVQQLRGCSHHRRCPRFTSRNAAWRGRRAGPRTRRHEHHTRRSQGGVHARQGHGRHHRSKAMPILPPRADDLPAGVSSAICSGRNRSRAGGHALAGRWPRGTRLRLIDLKGDACASVLLFSTAMPSERLNVADTLKVQWNAYLWVRIKPAMSDMGRKSSPGIEEDVAGTAAFLWRTSNEASSRRRLWRRQQFRRL